MLTLERVPHRAMGFAGILCARSVAPKNVFFVRYGLEVSRVTAPAISAEMVQFQACWNVRNQKLIGEAVNDYGFT